MKTKIIAFLLLSAIYFVACAPRGTTRDFTPVKINTGTTANDGTGDTLRLAMMKINTNFTAISNAFVTLQTMVAATSNSLLTAVSASTNGLASTNYANSLATGTSNALLTAMSSRDVATSNALVTAVNGVTNGFASTNYVNAQGTTVSNAMLTAITGATNAFASTNLVNAGITSYSNTVTTLLGAKAPTNSPIFFGQVNLANANLTNVNRLDMNSGWSVISNSSGPFVFATGASDRWWWDSSAHAHKASGRILYLGGSGTPTLVDSGSFVNLSGSLNVSANTFLTGWLSVTNGVITNGTFQMISP